MVAKKIVDYTLLDDLCRIQCTAKEIASVLHMSIATLRARIEADTGEAYLEYLYKRSMVGRKSLRRKQWAEAMRGDRTMLIWLGKQYLGQVERHEVGGIKDQPIQIEPYNMREIDFSDFDDEELAMMEKLGMKMKMKSIGAK